MFYLYRCDCRLSLKRKLAYLVGCTEKRSGEAFVFCCLAWEIVSAFHNFYVALSVIFHTLFQLLAFARQLPVSRATQCAHGISAQHPPLVVVRVCLCNGLRPPAPAYKPIHMLCRYVFEGGVGYKSYFWFASSDAVLLYSFGSGSITKSWS